MVAAAEVAAVEAPAGTFLPRQADDVPTKMVALFFYTYRRVDASVHARVM